ncbi:MAG: ATP-binding protein [Chloroflexota bacterium]
MDIAILLPLVMLLSAVVSFASGLFVLIQEPRNFLNRSFAIMCFILAFSNYSTSELWHAGTLETAFFWSRAAAVWPLTAVLLLYFILAAIGKVSSLRKLWTVVAIHLPALTFVGLGVFTDLLTGPPEKVSWGYTYGLPASLLVANLAIGWLMAVFVAAVVLTYRYYRTAGDYRDKRRAWWLLAWTASALLIALFTEAMYYGFNWAAPEIGDALYGLVTVVAAYAIWKYKLFSLNTAVAADEIVATMPDALLLVGLDGNVIDINRAALGLLGYQKSELLGRKMTNVFADGDGLSRESVERLVRQGPIGGYEVTLVTKTGKKVPASFSVSPVRHPDGSPVGAVCILNDLTERKETERKLQQLLHEEKRLRGELEKEIEYKVQYIRALVHELRTPLTSVVVTSDLMLEEAKEEPLASMAAVVHRGAVSLNARVEELLDLARGEVGALVLNLYQVDSQRLLAEIWEDMEPVAVLKKQSLVLELPQSLPVIWADKIRLRQVVLNLLNNSFKYTPAGGRVIIRGFEKDGSLTVEVEDNGRGIAESAMPHLFDAYRRPRADKVLGGLGVGLPLSKVIVEAHGGCIWARSIEGKGSIFTFRVPLSGPPEMETEETVK